MMCYSKNIVHWVLSTQLYSLKEERPPEEFNQAERMIDQSPSLQTAQFKESAMIVF
jgi:hypothetical protein